MGMGGWKSDFSVKISTSQSIPSKINFWHLPPPHGVGGKKHFPVQICTFHKIPSKEIFGCLTPSPHGVGL